MLYQATIRVKETGKVVFTEECREEDKPEIRVKAEKAADSIGSVVYVEFKPREELIEIVPSYMRKENE